MLQIPFEESYAKLIVVEYEYENRRLWSQKDKGLGKISAHCISPPTMKLRLSALPTLQVRHYQAHKVPPPVSPEVATWLSSFAANTPAPISLAQLLSFGRPLTPASVLDSVRYALREIPRRLATRVRHLEALPFIVGTNPYVAGVLAAYRESFMYLARYPPVHTLQENDAFARELEGIVRRHANDIPTMAKG